MKHLSLFLLILLPTFLSAQINSDSILHPITSLTDSFSFCSKRFKIPRKCVERDSANCCVLYSKSNQLVCLSGDALVWSEVPTLELAKMVYNGLIEITPQNQKEVVERKVEIFILGIKPIASAYFETESNYGSKRNFITAYAEVNEKIVIIQFESSSKITGKGKVKSAFQNIISWK
ncbi:hypothetical protein [Ferruginibacter sp.]|nr:hypothetical protein [Ferruginibacter sp.]